MLQNDKYIEFADDNSVEILALGSIQDGIDKKDKRADTYDAKDAKDTQGGVIKYMKEFAGATSEQLLALDSSPASGYNKTGHILTMSIERGSAPRPLPGGGRGAPARPYLVRLRFS